MEKAEANATPGNDSLAEALGAVMSEELAGSNGESAPVTRRRCRSKTKPKQTPAAEITNTPLPKQQPATPPTVPADIPMMPTQLDTSTAAGPTLPEPPDYTRRPDNCLISQQQFDNLIDAALPPRELPKPKHIFRKKANSHNQEVKRMYISNLFEMSM